MIVRKNIDVPMRDGTILRADVYLPDDSGPFPIVLMRTPYEKEVIDATDYLKPEHYVKVGYAVVVQDCRGTGKSEGQYIPWIGDAEDGYDTVEWSAVQPWSTGKVGMLGPSNLGGVQLLAAAMRPPHLVCISPAGTSPGFPFIRDGVMDLGGTSIWFMQQALTTTSRANVSAEELANLRKRIEVLSSEIEKHIKTIPLKNIALAHLEGIMMDNFYLEFIENLDDAGHWTFLHNPVNTRAIEIPTLLVVHWYDHLQKQMFMLYHDMKTFNVPGAKDNLYLYVGPWRSYSGIVGFDQEDCPPDKDQPIWYEGKCLSDITIDWFDYWLKGKDGSFDTTKHVYVKLLRDVNQGRHEDSWPVPTTKFVKYYLASGGSANSLHGDGKLLPEIQGSTSGHDSYIYNPMDPTPTKSGLVISPGDSLRQDQTVVEMRQDVLVYTTNILTEPLEILGPVSARIWAKTDCVDTDFVVKLIEVDSDGTPYNLIEGMVRARFRNGWDKPELLIPDAIYEYKIELGGIGIRLDAGHALRIEIASSNFPKWDRNLNSGKALGLDCDVKIAHQTVYHDTEHPSHIILPTIPLK